MSSYTFIDALKKLRGPFQKPLPSDGPFQCPSHSIGTGILVVSKPIVAFSPSQLPCITVATTPPGLGAVSTVYRHTSDAAQTYLPPVQAAVSLVPGVGGIIKGAIGGMLSTLQLIDVIQFRSRP